MTTPLTKLVASNIDFHVREGDPAQTIVFLHGIGSRGLSFEPLFTAWPKGPRLIAWNAPGYGGSLHHPRPWPTPSDYASLLLRGLASLRITAPVDVVGHSLGGLIAGAMARGWPERVRTLSLLSPALGYRIGKGATLSPQLQQRISDMETLGPIEMARQRAPRMLQAPDAHPQALAQINEAMCALTPRAYGQAVRLLACGDLAGDLQHVRCRTLIVTGTHDVVVSPQGARTLYDNHAKSGAVCRFAAIPGGHAIYLEALQATLSELLYHIEEPRP